MDKKAKIAMFSALAIIALLVATFTLAAKGPKPECNDKIDNDGDGNKDMADSGCSSRQDNDETDCGDGVCEGGETPASCVADCGLPDSCSDTDGGNYPFTFGTTNGYLNNNPYSNDDYCVDASNVMEYYCSGDYEQSSQGNCGTDSYGANYCMNGSVYRDLTDYFCSAGECDVTVTPEYVEFCSSPYECVSGECVIQDSCSDTDYGWDYFNQGTASGYLNEQYYEDTDYCINTTVVEYYCNGDYEEYTTYNCAFNATTCSSGACVY